MKGATQCELRGQLMETEVEGRGIKESIPQLMTSELFWSMNRTKSGEEGCEYIRSADAR